MKSLPPKRSIWRRRPVHMTMKRKAGWADVLPKELGDAVFRGSFMNLGSALVFGTALFTLGLWLAQSPASLEDPFKVLAKVSAFSALAFLSMNFLLSTRARWLEGLFGGMDRMYGAHCTVGRISLIWMIMHPIALAMANMGDRDRLTAIFLPGTDLGHTFGTLSLVLFFTLLALTIVYTQPYATWLSGHRFMGLVLLMSGCHALLSGSDVAAHPTLYAWTAALTCVGVLAFLYTLFLYRFIGRKARTTVADVVSRPGSLDVFLHRPTGFELRPGQFVYAGFDGTDGENHPYSISGWDDRLVRLSIKASGDLTEALPSLIGTGVEVTVHGPYGRFGEKRPKERGEVWIAGGIGITPFLSLLQAESQSPSGNDILLIWSYRVLGELPYEEDILGFAARIPGLEFVHWNSMERGRVDVAAMESLLGEDLTSRRFLICGPRAMMRSLSKQLVNAGVMPKDIVLEDFNLI